MTDDCFAHLQNITKFQRRLAAGTDDEPQRRVVRTLLAEEIRAVHSASQNKAG